MVSRTASPAAHASGLPPKVVPCCPAVSSAGDLGPKVDERADRDSAAQALGQGDRVGHDARRCW